jgi:hypothetical protein
MKKVTFASLFAVLSTMFAACSGDNPTMLGSAAPVATVATPDSLTSYQKEEKVRKENVVASKAKEIPVGEETFKMIVSFIESHGFMISGGPQNISIRSGHQYTFTDRIGNRHAFLAIRRDRAGNTSLNGTVGSIFVYSYYKGIRDQDHFFSWDIDAGTVHPYLLDYTGTWKAADDVKIAYEDFLKKVGI